MNNQHTKTKKAIDGWLNLYKPKGITSAHAVARVNRIFNSHESRNASNHAPLAEGILPSAFGKATKTVSLFMDAKKTYIFELTFGKQTNTDDSQSNIIKESNLLPTQEQLIALLPTFTGQLEQIPPQFSAIKKGGIRAYQHARAGINIELTKRTVTVYSLDLLSFSGTHATLKAIVSKGTYIRSLGRDIGQQLGCYAYVSSLERTTVGTFTKKNAVTLEDLERLKDDPVALEKLLISVEDF